MGTSYQLLDNGKATLDCDEMSCRFTLSFNSLRDGEPVASLKDLTAEQLVKAAIELLKVASYNLDVSDIQGIIAAERGRSSYYIGVLL